MKPCSSFLSQILSMNPNCLLRSCLPASCNDFSINPANSGLRECPRSRTLLLLWRSGISTDRWVPPGGFVTKGIPARRRLYTMADVFDVLWFFMLTRCTEWGFPQWMVSPPPLNVLPFIHTLNVAQLLWHHKRWSETNYLIQQKMLQCLKSRLTQFLCLFGSYL